MLRICSLSLIAVVMFLVPHRVCAQDMFKAQIKPFLDAHCVDCHGPDVKKAGLRLDDLKADFADPKAIALWIKAHDKLVAGEMPPKKRARPPQRDLDLVT